MNLAQRVKDYGKEISLDEVKITTANNLSKVKMFMKARKEEGSLSKFVKDDIEKITAPKEVLAEAKSVIVVAISYYCPDLGKEKKEGLKGKLSHFVTEQDYHRVLGDKLKKLAEFLKAEARDAKVYSFVDTGATVDRALAKRAGIGWQGKNCSIIHPEYGSWIFIGGLITNLNLDIDQPLEDRCGDCTRCLDACPTGALEAEYLLNAQRCLGQITLTKGYLSYEERKQLGTRIWGCDTCQEVCPHNKEVKSVEHFEFCSNQDRYPKLIPLLNLSNQEFKERFASTAMNWRGKRPIKRNAAIILGNLKDKAAVPELIKTLKEDPQAIVRGHAAWALGEIGTTEVKDALEECLQFEKNKKVREEVKKAIKLSAISHQLSAEE